MHCFHEGAKHYYITLMIWKGQKMNIKLNITNSNCDTVDFTGQMAQCRAPIKLSNIKISHRKESRASLCVTVTNGMERLD